MLIQEKITHQLSADSPPNLLALTFGLNICLKSSTRPNSSAAQWAWLLPHLLRINLLFSTGGFNIWLMVNWAVTCAISSITIPNLSSYSSLLNWYFPRGPDEWKEENGERRGRMEDEIEKWRREMVLLRVQCLMHSPYSLFISRSQSPSSSLPHPHAGQPWASGVGWGGDRKATAVVRGGR